MRMTIDMHPALDTTARVLWKVVRFPFLATVLLLAPIVYVVCGVMMVGGILGAVLFEISAVGPRFPFLQIIGLSSLFGVFAVLYYSLVAFIIKD